MGTSTLTCTRKHTWAAVDDLPNELLLAIFPLLPLKSLIAAQAVCRHWRALVQEAHLHPERRKLLDLFCELVRSPDAHSRPRVSAHQCDSDREEYLRFLTRSTNAPEDFVLWVREWPAWGVFGWFWPDLDESYKRPKLEDSQLLVDSARADSLAAWGFGASGWSEPASVSKPHVKILTLTGGKSPLVPGAAMHATRVLPVEFAEIGIQNIHSMTETEEDELSVEVIVLCFGGGNRALILDGSRGGEKLKGLVFAVGGGYTLNKSVIFSATWVEYLRKYLLVPHSRKPPAKLLVRT